MKKQADDAFSLLGGTPRPLPLNLLHAQARAINDQLRLQEAYRMSQTIENLGGPGSERARYVRAVMATPYHVSPVLPYLAGAMGVMTPPGTGVVHAVPDESDFRSGGGDPEMTALETGITHTASAVMMDQVGRDWAKLAQGEPYGPVDTAGYEQALQPEAYNRYPAALAPPPYLSGMGVGDVRHDTASQYARALLDSHAQQRTMYAPEEASHGEQARQQAGEAMRSFGHGFKSLGRAAGHGAIVATDAMGRGLRRFMETESTPTQRWGAGMQPAQQSNEYGQPIYG